MYNKHYKDIRWILNVTSLSQFSFTKEERFIDTLVIDIQIVQLINHHQRSLKVLSARDSTNLKSINFLFCFSKVASQMSDQLDT